MAANPIQTENSLTGTDQWQIENYSETLAPPNSYAYPFEAMTIEGYASETSVTAGQTLDLYVNTVYDEYTISVYRMGWYQGLGGRLINIRDPNTGKLSTNVRLSGVKQALPHTDTNFPYFIDCSNAWTKSYSLTIDSSFPSGVYLAKLSGYQHGDPAMKDQNYIVFVVRDDARASTYLFQSSVTTYAAYNPWGGHSFYASTSDSGLTSPKVSFNRPYFFNAGTGDFAKWELPMIRFLEREGLDVSYSTNIDTHNLNSANFQNRMLNHAAFLSVGHDEYWTQEMYDNIEAARDGKIPNSGLANYPPVNLAFFGSNNAYWKINLEASKTGQANRTLVSYKTDNDKWRNINRSEAALIGVQYIFDPYEGDITIKQCPAWLCNGPETIQSGDVLHGVLGYELDSIAETSPPGIMIIGESAFPYTWVNPPVTQHGHMTYYKAESGAGVFASGSMHWNWGLDTFWQDVTLTPPIDVTTRNKVQQISRNLLRHLQNRRPVESNLGPNLLFNHSLEDNVNNSATQPFDCWQVSPWGDNTAIWTRTTDAIDGIYAAQVEITSWTSGNQSLLPTRDLGQASGGCAPKIRPDKTYELSAYYKSTAESVLVLFILDSNNDWQWWTDGPSLSPSATWKKMTYKNIGPFPAGTQAISFGIHLTGAGKLVTDNYSLSEVISTQLPN